MNARERLQETLAQLQNSIKELQARYNELKKASDPTNKYGAARGTHLWEIEEILDSTQYIHQVIQEHLDKQASIAAQNRP